MTLRGFFDKIINDMHIPIAVGVFCITTVFHFWKRADLGTNYVNSIYAFYGFLGAHFGASQKWPDPPVPPTDPVTPAVVTDGATDGK